jgi:hypothetical protein
MGLEMDLLPSTSIKRAGFHVKSATFGHLMNSYALTRKRAPAARVEMEYECAPCQLVAGYPLYGLGDGLATLKCYQTGWFIRQIGNFRPSYELTKRGNFRPSYELTRNGLSSGSLRLDN